MTFALTYDGSGNVNGFTGTPPSALVIPSTTPVGVLPVIGIADTNFQTGQLGVFIHRRIFQTEQNNLKTHCYNM